MECVSALQLLPYELRLETYDYLIPLDQPCDSLMGLLLSCRQIGSEIEDVMYKEYLKVTKPFEDSWPSQFHGQVHFPYLGRLYSHKELVIEVPYVTDVSVSIAYRLRHGILTRPIRRIVINVVSSQNSPEELPRCSRPDPELILLTGRSYLGMLGLRVYGRVTIQFVKKPGLVRKFERRRTHCKYRHGCFHTDQAICTENSPLRICD